LNLLTLFYFFVFIFGAVVGSFLNVVSLRYNTGQPIVGGRSKCLNCAKKLKWRELIPIASFIFLRGKCSVCKSKISWQYFIVEMITGLVFLLVYNYYFQIFNEFSFHFPLSTLYFLIIFSLLIIIAIYDYHHQIIPDLFVWVFNGLAFCGLFRILDFNNLNLFRISNFEFRIFDWNNLLAGFVLFAFFASLWAISKGKWMGFGDAKLALGIGWLLGMGKGVMAITLSFWIGAIVGVFLLFMAKKRYNMGSNIAFGPFMILGTFIAFFWGDKIINFVFR